MRRILCAFVVILFGTPVALAQDAFNHVELGGSHRNLLFEWACFRYFDGHNNGMLFLRGRRRLASGLRIMYDRSASDRKLSP